MESKQQLKSLSPYKPGKNVEDVQNEFGLRKIIKLASNENPYGSSPAVKKAIERQLGELSVYPDGYASVLREKTAQFFGVKVEQLVFGDGTDEVIQMLCRAYLDQGCNSVMAKPTFSQYRHNTVVEGAEVREIDLKEGRHYFEGMADAVDQNTKIVWLCMVNNPTGEYIRKSELISFLQKVPKDVLVVCDEAYGEYVVADDYISGLSLMDKYPNLVVTRTFSKIYGLAALRVGFGVAHPGIISILEAIRPPFNTTKLSQFAAAAALEDQEYVKKSRDSNREGMELFYNFCKEFRLSHYPSQGNFILIDFNRNGDEVFDYLLKKGFIVRSGTALGYPNAVRITIGTKKETKELIEILSNWLRS